MLLVHATLQWHNMWLMLQELAGPALGRHPSVHTHISHMHTHAYAHTHAHMQMHVFDDCAPSHSNSSPLCRPPLPGSGPQLWQADILVLSLFITLILICAILIAGQDAGHSTVNICIGMCARVTYVSSKCFLSACVGPCACVCQ